MEISYKTIGALRNKLTREDFWKFICAVEMDNDPKMFAFVEWENSPEAAKFLTLLFQERDDLGMVTSDSVERAMYAAKGAGLLYCCYSNPYSKKPTFFGLERTVEKLAEKSPRSYAAIAMECSYIPPPEGQHNYTSMIAGQLTRLLCKNGTLVRTELMKDVQNATPCRCYVISKAAKERYGI